MDNQKTAFDGVAKSLHWIMAVLIILALVFGTILEDMPLKERLFNLMFHSGVGIIILGFAVYRIYWRRNNPPPALPETMSPGLAKASVWNTRLLYGLMVFMPIAGILQAATYTEGSIYPFGLFNLTALLPSSEGAMRVFHIAHGLGGKLMILSLLIHIGAAFKHLLVDKDDVFQRMWPGRNR